MAAVVVVVEVEMRLDAVGRVEGVTGREVLLVVPAA